jgi:Carboxypeptidase regulatory-like domain/TonB dependent receptor
MKPIREVAGDEELLTVLRRLVSRRCRTWILILLFGAGLWSPAPSNAQAISATLRGTVTDGSGANIPGAKITLSEPSTGRVVRQATSSSSGEFEFDELQPSTYLLSCDATGFKSFQAQDIVLDPGQIRRVDPILAIGETSTTVTVSAGAAVINTESSTMSETFSQSQQEKAPLVTTFPDAYILLTLSPGVQGGNGDYPVINGQQQTQQNQSFDGIPNDLYGQQSNNSNFFEQTSATTFNAPAESAVPADIELVTHRGSNAIHGIASYQIYDSVLNASEYFPPPKTPYILHEWNLAAGGPIWKNRAFFYAQWFAQSIPLGTPYLISVPTPSYRAGVFSQTIIDPLTGLPFPNNTIPASRMSPVALNIQNQYYPAPTGSYANLPPVNNYPFVFPYNSDLYKGNWPLGRIDYNISQKNSMFVRWLLRDTPYVLNDGVPSAIWTRVRREQQWAAGDTHIFSSHLDNNFRFGLGLDYMADGGAQRGVTPPNGATALANIGLLGSNPSNSTGQGLPSISISGLQEIEDVPGGVKFNDTDVTVVDNADWQTGRHVWKFGFIYQDYRATYGFVNDYGTLNFDGSVTGNAYADFLLGIPQSSARTNPLPTRHLYVSNWGIYAQDNFQLSPKLTLNYGLRYDYYGTPDAPDNRMYNWDPASGDVIVSQAGMADISPLYPSSITVTPGAVRAISDKTNFAPRIGAAYRLSKNSVIRGGYGIYTARLDAGYILAPGNAISSVGPNGYGTYNPFQLINPQLGSTGPFSITQTYLNVVNPGAQPLLQFPNPYPASTSLAAVPTQTVYGYPRQSNLGLIQQFNGTYEREINKIGLRASYLGSRSSGLNYVLNIDLPHPSTTPFTQANLPYPQFYQAYYTHYDGGAKYDAVQFEARRRAGGLTFDASYSLQRSIANYLNTQNPYSVLNNWANDGVTMRQYAVISGSYNLPFGKDQRYLSNATGVVKNAATGWVITSINYLGSGEWYSPSFTGSDPSNTGTFGGLPDKVGNPHSFAGGKQTLEAFNDAAYAVPQTGTFGNAQVNSLESQHLYLMHLGILKATPITERINFDFQCQIANLLNHPEFAIPSGIISVPGGNQYTSQLGTFNSLERGQPRQISFRGAFRF